MVSMLQHTFSKSDFLMKQNVLNSVNSIAIKDYISLPINPPKCPAHSTLWIHTYVTPKSPFSLLFWTTSWISLQLRPRQEFSHSTGRENGGPVWAMGLSKRTPVALPHNQGLRDNKTFWSWSPAMTRKCLSWKSTDINPLPRKKSPVVFLYFIILFFSNNDSWKRIQILESVAKEKVSRKGCGN